ncbi:imelysin family protein [Thiosocius teredinicola]|uniref:imelysin family protein n=1 Tax=Thiosocius teredinicola TaxID=1973002 RepID=UPI000990EE99
MTSLKTFCRNIALLLGTVMVTAAWAEPVNYNLAVADEHVIPAYQKLAQTTQQLNAAAPACAQGETGLNQLRAAYRPAYLAWQGIEHLRFGPIQTLSRDYRYQLWPDKRGSVGKHLRKLLSKPDATSLDPDTFAGGSVAVQGFSALERLLFDGDTKNADDEWRCRVIGAITANLERMSAETLAEWTEGSYAHRDMFATAIDGNDYYDSDDELSAKLLNNLHTQLERMVDQKLGRALREEIKRALPKRAEAWRSGLSNAALRANLQATYALYRVGFAPRVGNEQLNQRIAGLFDSSLATLDALQIPIPEAVIDADARGKLVELKTQLATLNDVIGGELSQALGLPLGFNSLDGD